MRFWNWKPPDGEGGEEERELRLDGVIAEESWLDDDVTPQLFEEELNAGSGDITVWINSPGGDCIAAARIYNLLLDYRGKVTVKIDGIAASAASVIAMAGDKVLVSPVSMLMIHNPMTQTMGDHNDMRKAIEMLGEVKESIINAYQKKTGLSRGKISRMMEEETWMDAAKAIELGFADGMMERRGSEEGGEKEEKQTDLNNQSSLSSQFSQSLQSPHSTLYAAKAHQAAFLNRLAEKYKNNGETDKATENKTTAQELLERLEKLRIKDGGKE